jgi:hypothetical protein
VIHVTGGVLKRKRELKIRIFSEPGFGGIKGLAGFCLSELEFMELRNE